MRYKVRGHEIRSENTAKPVTSAGRWLLDWINELDPRYRGLDLGCGKLRYTIPMAQRISRVTAVDSNVQLDRLQKLFDRTSTIRNYADEHLPNVHVHSVEDQEWKLRRYDVILCSNVLSAIPSIQTRSELISSARCLLKCGGTFLLTTQFKNSHFSSWTDDPRATRHCDGFIVRAPNGVSFYALLDSSKLVKICRDAGLTIVSAGHAKELAYVFATKIASE